MNASEAALHERQTEAFIAASPSAVSFRRRIKGPDGKGGEKVIRTDELRPQTVRIIGLRMPTVRTTPEGREVRVEKAVVGSPKLDVKLGDVFTRQGQAFEVIHVSDSPSWRVSAEVIERGA